MSYLQRPAATSGMMHGPYEESSEDEDGGPTAFLPFTTNAVQIMDPRYKRSLELDQYSPNASKRRKFHNAAGTAATLGRYAATRVSVSFSVVVFAGVVPLCPFSSVVRTRFYVFVVFSSFS